MQRVKDIVKGCWTGRISELSDQLIRRMLHKGDLVKVDHPKIVCEGRHNNPYLQPIVYEQLIRAVEFKQDSITLTSCFRTVPQQWILRQQYERNLCSITGAALPGHSQHQDGTAIDVGKWANWKHALLHNGFKWLGSWDAVHFWYPTDVDLGKLQLMEWQSLWNEFNPNDQIEVDGIYGSDTFRTIANAPINGFGTNLIMQKGDESKAVGSLQLRLREALGLSPQELAGDCKFGKQTARYLYLFQEKYTDILPTGKCDRKTYEALFQTVPT